MCAVDTCWNPEKIILKNVDVLFAQKPKLNQLAKLKSICVRLMHAKCRKADKIIRICTNYIRSSCKISNSMKYIVCDSDLVDWIQFTWCLKNKSFSRLNEFMFCLITKMQTIHSHMFVIYLHLVTFRKCHQSGPTQYVYICNGYKFVYMCHI